MPLLDQLFSSIISNPPVVNPGAGGWDVILTQFMADQRGRHGFGLLSRLIGVDDVPSAASGTILVTCPPGWRAMPLLVLVFAASNPNGDLTFTIADGTGTGEMWNQNVELETIGGGPEFDKMPFLVWPNPVGADSFATEFAQMTPIIDGDDLDKNTFRVNRDGANDISYNFFTYGMAWPSSD